MENRKHPRIDTSGMAIDVSDGYGFYSGSVNNLSRFGLCMNDLPRRLDQKAKRLSIVVSGRGKNFKMVGRPRWALEGKYNKDVGVEIVHAPWGWTEFVMSLEPKVNDPWESTIHL